MNIYTVIYSTGNKQEIIKSKISRALAYWMIKEKKKTGNYSQGKFKVITNK